MAVASISVHTEIDTFNDPDPPVEHEAVIKMKITETHFLKISKKFIEAELNPGDDF